MEKFWFSLYILCRRLPGIRRLLRRTEWEVFRFLPLDAYGTGIQTMRCCFRNILVGTAFFLFGIVLAGGRMMWLLPDLVLAVAAGKNWFYGWKQKQEARLVAQLLEFLEELRYAYYRNRDVEEALYEAWTEAGEELKLHLAVMEDCFFGEGIPEEYQDRLPNRFYTTFLAICQSAIRYGDYDEDGKSFFLSDLEDLQQSMNLELLKWERERAIFGGLFAVLSLPILFMPLMEAWSLRQVPELAPFYGGCQGSLVRLAAYAVTGVLLYLLRMLRENSRGQEGVGEEEKESLRGMDSEGEAEGGQAANRDEAGAGRAEDGGESQENGTGVRWWKEVSARLPLVWNEREGQFGRRTAQLLHVIFPGSSLYRFYLYRLLWMAGVGFFGLLWCLYYRAPLGWGLLWLLLAVGASFVPYLRLVFGALLYGSGVEEEILQYRTILLLLSRVPHMNVEVLLEWMERFGYYFRPALTECIDKYGSAEEEALEELKAKQDFPDFGRLVEDLAAADRVGVKEAFRDLVVQREFWAMRIRQTQEMGLKQKELWMQAVAYLPFGISVFCYLVLPFLYQGMKSLLDFVEWTA